MTARLLDDVERELRRYVVVEDYESAALALWVLHTWAFEGATATPYLAVVSAEKRSGKSRLIEVLELLVRQPWKLVSASESALFRKIAQDRPTLLLDEVDAIFGAGTERTQALRGVLNAGNRPGASVARCVSESGSVRVVDFEVYGPKVLAGIDSGAWPDTIIDRSVVIRMKRKPLSQPVEPLRARLVAPEMQRLKDRLAAWAEDAVPELVDAWPVAPASLNDRAADAWEPLLAIADAAGGAWPQRARSAALALSFNAEDDASLGVQLLEITRKVLAGRDVIATADLLAAINDDELTPFGGWRDGQGLDARGLARLLKPYGIRPQTVRVGTATPKGYPRIVFEDAFSRYLPPLAGAATSATSATPSSGVSLVADVADMGEGVPR